ncbi:MAG: SDR family oxidoreductase [Clostridia bacterium]|nr:SDR family oxidoreductase [Clostridia bacterium]
MKTMLITGGARGIGAQLVRHFTAAGWRVMFCYRQSRETAERLAAETGALAFCCDVRREEQVKAMMAEALRTFRHLDALICNAGAAWSGLMEDMPAEAYDLLADTNQRGAFLCVREALPFLREAHGSILLISSMWGVVGASCEAAYSATKAALQCMARALAKEVGPSGVRVNCVAPGAVDTDMMAAYTEADKQALAEDTPLGRLCTVQDIADAADFLLSTRASFITGQTLVVDGGFTL